MGLRAAAQSTLVRLSGRTPAGFAFGGDVGPRIVDGRPPARAANDNRAPAGVLARRALWRALTLAPPLIAAAVIIAAIAGG